MKYSYSKRYGSIKYLISVVKELKLSGRRATLRPFCTDASHLDDTFIKTVGRRDVGFLERLSVVRMIALSCYGSYLCQRIRDVSSLPQTRSLLLHVWNCQTLTSTMNESLPLILLSIRDQINKDYPQNHRFDIISTLVSILFSMTMLYLRAFRVQKSFLQKRWDFN